MELSTLLLADPRVNRSRWRVSAKASKAHPALCSSTFDAYRNFVLAGFYGKTSQERSRAKMGGAFGQLLREMDELGYSLAWRVLDAQFFGVAQRRRRLFLVGHLGAESPAEVLFEPDCLSGNPQSSREKRKELARRAGRSVACAGFKYSAAPRANTIGYAEEQANTLTADWHAPAVLPLSDTGQHYMAMSQYGTEVAGCLTALGIGADGDPAFTLMANHPHMVAAGSGSEPIAMGDLNAHTAICRNVCPTLKCGGDGAMVASETADKIMEANPMLVRRLTPLECERLQGFPDGHTLIGWKGKPAEECPDGPRYKAIGNSMAVPVMRWIGKRIAAADKN